MAMMMRVAEDHVFIMSFAFTDYSRMKRRKQLPSFSKRSLPVQASLAMHRIDRTFLFCLILPLHENFETQTYLNSLQAHYLSSLHPF